jgi:hypothetical protein
MHGNISSVKAGVWNAQELAAAGGGRSDRKWALAVEQLEETRPAVMVILEVEGDIVAIRHRRRQLRKLHYDVRFLAGEGGEGEAAGSRANGVLALVDTAQCSFVSYSRVDERVLGAGP